MKKVILLLSMCSLMVFSCGKKEEKETIIEKETVVVPGETETVTPPPAETNPDGTSVEVGKNGISVSTKDGNNNTKVTLSKDTTRVNIKK